ncbi:hypothetical protein [Massilia sp.]|uniref:hypothetical protein n=1 Tax=Massilia sp. TaxID=1882437 RepID=UPI002899A99E|nr:hypothetical protein [Massilia sp.]
MQPDLVRHAARWTPRAVACVEATPIWGVFTKKTRRFFGAIGAGTHPAKSTMNALLEKDFKPQQLYRSQGGLS